MTKLGKKILEKFTKWFEAPVDQRIKIPDEVEDTDMYMAFRAGYMSARRLETDQTWENYKRSMQREMKQAGAIRKPKKGKQYGKIS